MDYNEFGILESNIDTTMRYSDEIEFVTGQLNEIAHAGGRYSRSVQLPIAIRIVKELNLMRRRGKKTKPTS